MSNTETEVKILVEDLGPVAAKLKSVGAELKAPRIYERNVRYENADETLTSSERVVRLRQDSRTRLTYKEGGTSQIPGIITRTELEVTVSDFDTMDLILQKLGYHSAWLYEKYRTTYEYGDCEIVLDEMPFGLFVEVEGESDAIEKVLSALDLVAAHRVAASYSALFFRGKERLNLPFRDLTFENFKGILVPRDIFE